MPESTARYGKYQPVRVDAEVPGSIDVLSEAATPIRRISIPRPRRCAFRTLKRICSTVREASRRRLTAVPKVRVYGPLPLGGARGAPGANFDPKAGSGHP
jgi:hypothetical protein